MVFEAALSWAEVECQQQDLALSIENKRGVLGKALYLIRIPTMALDDFANGAVQSGVLTLNETNDIFLWYTAAKKPELQSPQGVRPPALPPFPVVRLPEQPVALPGPLRQHPVRRRQEGVHRGLWAARLQLRLGRVQRQDRTQDRKSTRLNSSH